MNSIRTHIRSVPCKGLYIFKFVEEFEIGLIDLIVALIELIGKSAAFSVFDLLQLDVASVVDV